MSSEKNNINPLSLRVAISVTNDLVTDQRVHRSCSALHEAGYRVTLIGRMLPESIPLERAYRTCRMRLFFRKKAIFYAEYNIRLFFKLLFMPADIFYANDTDTLPANYLAALIRRKPLFFDAHEMFPEVPELVGRSHVKRFWTAIENWIFPQIARRSNMAAVTVCQSIADIYMQRYHLPMAVVRNVPMYYPQQESNELQLTQFSERILLYQGAVNLGRGIEWVMDAMTYLPDCRLVVAGIGDKYDELKGMAEAKGYRNVTFLGRVEPSVLHSFTSKASLGLSLLENRGLNYYYSLPNRIADFVQAGVPVLATDFPEIHRVVEKYGIGTLVPPQPFDRVSNSSQPPEPSQLAVAIRNALDYWDSVSPEERSNRFSLAASELSWDNDKKVLLGHLQTIV